MQKYLASVAAEVWAQLDQEAGLALFPREAVSPFLHVVKDLRESSESP